jgi:hypothetical protein
MPLVSPRTRLSISVPPARIRKLRIVLFGTGELQNELQHSHKLRDKFTKYLPKCLSKCTELREFVIFARSRDGPAAHRFLENQILGELRSISVRCNIRWEQKEVAGNGNSDGLYLGERGKDIVRDWQGENVHYVSSLRARTNP